MGEALPFNSLSYVRKLKAVGVPEKQAEVQAEVMLELIESQLVTKRDQRESEFSLKRDIKELELRIHASMKELESSLTLKMGALAGFTITVLAVLIKIF